MMSPKICSWVRYAFGPDSHFIEGDTRINYSIEFSGHNYKRTHNNMLMTKRARVNQLPSKGIGDVLLRDEIGNELLE